MILNAILMVLLPGKIVTRFTEIIRHVCDPPRRRKANPPQQSPSCSKVSAYGAISLGISTNAPDDRIVILEDTVEIRCAAENAVSLHTSDTIDMARLLKSTTRLRPDRIIVGEVRGCTALMLLKAWNTGHPGGVTTIHSNTAMSALRRLEQLRRKRRAEEEQSRQPPVCSSAFRRQHV